MTGDDDDDRLGEPPPPSLSPTSTPEDIHMDDIKTLGHNNINNKKYQCIECDYTTAYSSNLIKHTRRHAKHTDTVSSDKSINTNGDTTIQTQVQPLLIDKKKKLKCKDCDYRCAYKSTMRQHEQKHLKKKGPVICNKCQIQCSTSKELKKHMLIHEEVKHFGCDQCEFVCSVFADLIVHKRIHDEEEEQQLNYVQDDNYSDDDDQPMNIFDMLKIEIKEEDDEITPPLLIKTEEEDDEDESKEDDEERNYEMILSEEKNGLKSKRFECKLCDYSCRYLSGMKLHQQRHSGIKLYQCDECSYKCSYSSSLTKHKRTHTGEKPYECDQCEAKFARTDHLKNHKITHTHKKKIKPQMPVNDIVQELIKMKDISLTKITKSEAETHDDKRFQCDECDYSCSYLSSLKLHQQRHSGVKLYQCDLCSYRCAYSSSLTKHRRTHTGEKPYECPHCGNRFARGDHLKAHIQSHLRPKSKLNKKQRQIQESNEEYSNVLSKLLKNNVNVYRFQCDTCDFRCMYPRELVEHNKTHLGEDILFKCNRCQFTCPSATEMTRHRKLVHGDGRCYSCDKCDYKTTHSGNFNKHMRVHLKYSQSSSSTGSNKEFKCDKCPFASPREDLLIKHQVIHVGFTPIAQYTDSEPDVETSYDEPVQESPLDFSLSS